METFLSFLTTPTIFALSIFLCSLVWLSNTIVRPNKKSPPQAGGAWPVIGHLHLLGGPEPAHLVLGKMADKHGPIFTIKMGVHHTLVISDSDMAKQCFTTHDKAFANRPLTLATEILGYDRKLFGFSPYGPYWRQVRKIATLELLSTHRLEMLKGVREAETRAAAKDLYKLWERNKNSSGNCGSNKALVEMRRWFGDVTVNVILRMIVGKSVVVGEGSHDEGLKRALREFFDLSGMFVAGDAVPFLKWLDIGEYEKAMKRVSKELDLVVGEWLKEKKKKKKKSSVNGDGDFMDVMLKILDESSNEELLGSDSDTVNKLTCLNLILAASDTTAVTLNWALSLLINHPNALKQLQLELDNQIGRQRQAKESDLTNLVYLKAVIKETMRLYPAGPLSVPHESTEDITIGDFHIPAGTTLLTNISKIQRDPKSWSNPCKFHPERFLTSHKDVDYRGQHFEFMPFGSGRRICPGITFAVQAMQLTLAILVHGFDLETPSGEPVDMTESIGLTNIRATPLELLITPRLPSHLYE